MSAGQTQFDLVIVGTGFAGSFFLMRSEGGETIPEIAEGITECEWLPVEEAMTRVTYENAREMIRTAIRYLETSIPSDPALR